MPDFAALPPEINSGRMYSGPGSGPMLAAAAAWDAIAATLTAAANGYASVLSELTGNVWSGPSSLSMAAAAAPYVAWLHDTAAQAEQTAAQAKAAAAAYELAFAMTVPPPVIAANRSLLMTLVATNFFGQNTPAIAATEAHYAQMWAQDATAMYGYAGSSSAASQLRRFTSPKPTTNPAGAAAESAGSTAGGPMTVPALPSTPPLALQSTAPTAPSLSTLLSPALTAINIGSATPKILNTALSTISSTTSGRNVVIQNARMDAQAANDAGQTPRPQRLVSAQSAGAAVAARIGRAVPVGALSTPPTWATTAPGPTAPALPPAGAETAAAAPTQMAPAPGNVFSQTALGTLSRHGPDAQRPKSKPVIVRSPAAG